MINLKNKTPENENLKKIVNIVEKILYFDKLQKGKGLPLYLTHVAKVSDHTQLKMLTPKQMLQRLPIFMDSENSKTSEPHRLLLNLLDNINLKRSDKYVALSNLSI